MLKSLFLFLSKLLGNSGARVLSGAGVGLVSFATMMPLCVGMLNAANSAMSGIPGDVAGLLGLAGCGQALSIIGSAILTRVALDSASLSFAKTGTSS